MIFLRSLKELNETRSLAKIDFNDGNSAVGFVVYADSETFDMYIMDNVFNEKVLDEDSDGAIMLESEEDAKGIDFIFTKASYNTGEIDNIVHDISHKFPVEKTLFFGTTQHEIYKNHQMIQDKLSGKKPGRDIVFTNFPSSLNGDSFTVITKTKEEKRENKEDEQK